MIETSTPRAAMDFESPQIVDVPEGETLAQVKDHPE